MLLFSKKMAIKKRATEQSEKQQGTLTFTIFHIVKMTWSKFSTFMKYIYFVYIQASFLDLILVL